MTASDIPLCTAAHTAFLIDTDKTVRPCCAYYGNHGENTPSVGNLKRQSVKEVMESATWREIRDQLARHEVPAGCAGCISRYRNIGWSPKVNFDRRLDNWDKGITFMEINSSNVCNLQCRHCNPRFSSSWVKESGEGELYPPDTRLVLDSLEELDLQYLEAVMFKGGEPMLNADCEAVLEHLDAVGVLPQVKVNFVTNASTIRRRIFELLAKAKGVGFTISMDGVGEVQRYIRHGNSSIENIESFIAEASQLGTTDFNYMTSIMAYNVFSLDEIAQWWQGLRERHGGRIRAPRFNNVVNHPAYLSVNILRDETRKRLIDKYTRLDEALYGPAIRQLERRYAGDAVRARFLEYTSDLDRRLGMSFSDSIPELAAEFEGAAS